MKNLVATILGACVAMLVTSGIVAFATAQSDKAGIETEVQVRPIDDEVVPSDEAYAAEDISDEEVEERISALIDVQYQHAVEQRAAL